MVANLEKFQLIFQGTNGEQKLGLKIHYETIKQCQQVKLLGATIDSKLNFDKHILECGKGNKKLSAFSRIRNYFDNNRAGILCKTTVLAKSNYCPLIWMLSSKVAKRAIRVLHKYDNLSFDKCLMKEAEITIHVKNLH